MNENYKAIEIVEEKKKSLNSRLRYGLIFTLTFLCTLLLTAYIQYVNVQHKQSRAEYFAYSIGSEIYEILLSQLNKTQVLEAYLIQSGGSFADAEKVAEMLLHEDEAIRNVLFAPNGIVEGVFPIDTNEPVLGLNMYEDGLGNWEARAAIEAEELYMAGPFEMVEGGMGIAGRKPVFLENENGERYFWGIVSVMLDFPEILKDTSMQYLNEHGFACEVWRISPDQWKRQTILETDTPVSSHSVTYNYEISMFNAEWTISVAPLNPWYADITLWLCLAGGVLISVFITYIVYSKEKLRQVQQKEAELEIEYLKEKLEHEQSNVLFSQIRSHFFYHTLNSLQALVILDPDAAYKMVGDFSHYMRFNLDCLTTAGGIGSFKAEIKAIKAYTDINQQQLGDRLKMVYEIPDVDFDIPVLTIQPIVENAILHGIKPKVGGGTVTVRLEDLEDCWQVSVEDDGVGFDQSSAGTHRSIGMTNVRKRLEKFPGSTMQIESHPEVGTKVMIRYLKKNKLFMF